MAGSFPLNKNFFPLSPSAQPPTPQIQAAYYIVRGVRFELQSLVPQALAADGVSVSQTQVQQWVASLQSAFDILNRIPMTLIYPPPLWSTYVQRAAAQIEQAIALLSSIPIAAPLIYPPVPGQARILLQTLTQLINLLQAAEYNLLLALQSV